MDREKVIRKLQDALVNSEENGKIYAEIRRPIVFDAIAMLKEQNVETEWCERCGRVRLKSKWEGR